MQPNFWDVFFLFVFVQRICYLNIYFKHYEIGLMMKFDGMCCDLCRFQSRKSRNMIEKELTCGYFLQLLLVTILAELLVMYYDFTDSRKIENGLSGENIMKSSRRQDTLLMI